MVSAPLLRQAALFHAEHNLSQVSQQEDFRDIVSGTPGLAEVPLMKASSCCIVYVNSRK